MWHVIRMLWTVTAVTFSIFTFTFLELMSHRCVSAWTDLNVPASHSHAPVIETRDTRNWRQFFRFHSIRRIIRLKKSFGHIWPRWWLEMMFFFVSLFKFHTRGGCLRNYTVFAIVRSPNSIAVDCKVILIIYFRYRCHSSWLRAICFTMQTPCVGHWARAHTRTGQTKNIKFFLSLH